ncbi:2-C-methyl-D-erythritol 4-phosphate cytidylyltransferase [bioreactor metagenome]|uniref:2-C-methyl-D-erythritol 4-phosphate cytidylyltransferase n=1 Tax=bioreactor metagenome TaxID=1076179 RepID=A0A645GG55_9ZZZZ
MGGLCASPQLQKVIKVVAGGSLRIESVLSGVREAPREAELIAVHDGARPFASPRLLEEVIRKAAQCGAAAPAIPVKDTVKRAGGAVVEETLNRSDLFFVQTPQVFDAALLRGALEQALAAGEAPTDDCATVERLGMKVALTVGSDYNFKITTPLDLVLAGAVLEEGGFLADRTGV